MIDHVGPGGDFRQQHRIGDGTDSNRQSRVAFEMCEVRRATRRKIVEDDNIVPQFQQPFREMAADETGTSRNQTPRHVVPLNSQSQPGAKPISMDPTHTSSGLVISKPMRGRDDTEPARASTTEPSVCDSARP